MLIWALIGGYGHMKTASQALLVQQYLSEEAVVRSSIWSTSTIYLTGKSALFCFFAFEQRALPRCSFAVGVALSPFQVAYNILSFQDDEEDEGAPSNDIDRLL